MLYNRRPSGHPSNADRNLLIRPLLALDGHHNLPLARFYVALEMKNLWNPRCLFTRFLYCFSCYAMETGV